MKRKILALAFGLMAVGCGGADPARPGAPHPQPQAGPPVELPAYFTSLLGEYEVTEQDWEPVQGRLSVFATDTELGLAVTPPADAESPARPLRLVTPRDRTTIREEDGGVLQSYVVGPEEKIEIRYAPPRDELWVDAIDCRPGVCLTHQLTARPASRNAAAVTPR